VGPPLAIPITKHRLTNTARDVETLIAISLRLRNVACTVGVDQSDEIVIPPDKSQLSLHVEATTNVVRDADLKVSDVDGSFTAGTVPRADRARDQL
jgi:hypothetical protein